MIRLPIESNYCSEAVLKFIKKPKFFLTAKVTKSFKHFSYFKVKYFAPMKHT